ncbi:hypothetical protein B0H17DRAFT_1146386 [Mycena rosella]|uniref:Uncharacterized protein n=1 Tax=Mycena rosella TaxID=1033263 RepID=A0AAD7CP13_MYCRO|nr:hypothetical protein B0H17DRAFT_1146386 [Mycena rosella]
MHRARRTTDDDQEDVGHESSDKDRYLGTGIAVFAVRPLYIIMLQKNLFRRSQVNMNPNTKPVEAWQSLVISVFRSAMVGDGSASLCRRPSARHGSAAVTGDHNYLPVLVMYDGRITRGDRSADLYWRPVNPSTGYPSPSVSASLSDL